MVYLQVKYGVCVINQNSLHKKLWIELFVINYSIPRCDLICTTHSIQSTTIHIYILKKILYYYRPSLTKCLCTGLYCTILHDQQNSLILFTLQFCNVCGNQHSQFTVHTFVHIRFTIVVIIIMINMKIKVNAIHNFGLKFVQHTSLQ